MRYLSVCSGVEAASLAWEPLGWEPVAFCEIEPFPSAVLAARWPKVPNLGDMTKVSFNHEKGIITNGRTDVAIPDGGVDILVGGTPCQSFSVAGKREGLRGLSGLCLDYVRLAYEGRFPWFVWENVPGVFSSDKGRDFATFLSYMVGYEINVPKDGWKTSGVVKNRRADRFGLAWRVLDVQYTRVDGFPYAIPQRRRRVFVVGYLGDWTRAARVLLEREVDVGDHPPRREQVEEVAKCFGVGAGYADGVDAGVGALFGGAYENHAQDSRVRQLDGVFLQLNAKDGTGGNNLPLVVFVGTDAIRERIRQIFAEYEDEWPEYEWREVTDEILLNIYIDDDGKRRATAFQVSDTEHEFGVDIEYVGDAARSIPFVKTAHPMHAGEPQGYKDGDVHPTLNVFENGANEKRAACVICHQAVLVTSFAQNEREEVRDLNNLAGACSSNDGTHQRTYVAVTGGWRCYPLDADKLKPSKNTEESLMKGCRKGGCGFGVGNDGDPAYTLNAVDRHGVAVCVPIAYGFKAGQSKDGGIGFEKENSPTVNAKMSALEPTVMVCLGVDRWNQAAKDGDRQTVGIGEEGDALPTIQAAHHHAVAYGVTMDATKGFPCVEGVPQTLMQGTCTGHKVGVILAPCIVRRLLPIETERLMGFPSQHTAPRFTPERIEELIPDFIERFAQWDIINGKDPAKVKRKTAAQVRKWLSAMGTPDQPDAPRYKACGNSMGVNCMRWIGQRLDMVVAEDKEATS